MISEREGTSGVAPPAHTRTRLLDYLPRHLQETLGETPGFLSQTSAHVLSSPGKMLRPLLLLDACRSAGGDPEVAFPAAAGTEYGHIASLVHDDIIDGDSKRRGQETLHVKYDLPSAILTGDLLIFETFLSYTECTDAGARPENVLRAIRILASTCIEMCKGQALEAVISGDLDVGEDVYLRVIRLKTASVCRAAAKIGACLADAPDDSVEALGAYGDNLGMAFQIVDDVLSYEGSPGVTGKTLESDVRNRRVTLPVIYTLRSDDAEAAERVRSLLLDGAADEERSRGELRTLLVRSGGLDRARALADRYTREAQRQLYRLPPSEARDRLYSLAEVSLTRDR